jgi:hypothetical protein
LVSFLKGRNIQSTAFYSFRIEET